MKEKPLTHAQRLIAKERNKITSTKKDDNFVAREEVKKSEPENKDIILHLGRPARAK